MKFSKEDTQKVKGMAIIFMLFHHCFLAPDRYAGKSVSFFPFPEWIVNDVALAMKICVAIFVFLTAYGITLSFKRINNEYILSRKKIENMMIRRYVKVMSGFIFIFLLLQIFSVVTGKGWYTHIYGKKPISIFYFLIDMFGLAQLFHTPTFISTFWYMSLAQIIIFVLPCMILLYKKCGATVVIALSILVSVLFPVPTANASYKKSYAFFSIYIVCMAVGMLAADRNLLARMKSHNPIKNFPVVGKSIKFIIYMVVIIMLLYVRHICRLTTLLPSLEGILSLLVIGFFFEFINDIPIIKNILDILGKYSMDIFLIHSFIRAAWYYDFTYSFKNAYLIIVVLLIVSLGVSMIVEWIKKLIKFDRGVQWIINKVVIDESLE